MKTPPAHYNPEPMFGLRTPTPPLSLWLAHLGLTMTDVLHFWATLRMVEERS